MSRFQWSRVALLCAALMMAFSLLVACGGGDDDDDGGSGGGDFPVPSGADKLGEDSASAEELDAQDIDISDATALAYKVSGSNVDEVSDFYENDAGDDWTVDEHAALGDLMIAVLHNGDQLVLVTAMTATAARDQGGADLGDLEVNLDELEDDDIVIVGATFTCNEDSIDTCIEAMGLGL